MIWASVPTASGGTGGGTSIVVLSTDFTGRTVNGNTAAKITWTTDGVSDPGDLTAVDVNTTGKLAGLFTTIDAADRFIPNLNVEREGPWSTTLTLNLTVPEITLEDVVLDYQHLGNRATIPTINKNGKLTVTVTGSVSGLLDSVAISHNVAANDGSGSDTFTFAAPLTLTDSEGYDVTILAEGVSTAAEKLLLPLYFFAYGSKQFNISCSHLHRTDT
jgi:hypothetical protein